MKSKFRVLKTVIASLLVLSTFMSNLAYAGMQAGSNESGGGGYIKPTGNKVMKANGVIFGLEVTSNITTESEKDIIKEQQAAAKETAGKVYFDEIGATIVDNYLYHYPDFLCDVNITNRYALIIRDTYNSESKLNVNKQFMVGGSNGLKSEAPFAKVYRCANKGTAPAYTLGSLVSLKLSPEQQKAFLKGELSFDVVREQMSNIKADYDVAASAFVKQFVNMGTLGDHLNSILTYDNSEKDLLTYLDFVTLIYYMTGQNAHSEYAVKTYLKNLNADGSDSFVTLFMASVVSFSEDNNPSWDWYTLPNYYSYASGASVDRYQNIVYSKVTQRKAVNQKTTSPNAFTASTEKAWIADFFKQYEGVKTLNKDGSFRGYSNANRIFMWWSENQYSSASFDNWKSATMLMPTDMWGHKTGTLGFTYFNTARVQLTTDPEPRGDIQLYIDGSKNNSVEKPGTKTSATVVIDLTSTKKQRSYTELVFDDAKRRGKPVRVTIQLSAKTVDGTPDNSSNFDSLLIPAGLTINSSKRIIWNDVTWEEFEPYMLGEKVMKWNDSDITINDATKIEYYATLTIDVVESPIKITGKFNGVGEEPNPDKYTAQTSWTCVPGETPPDPTDPEPPKTGSYHSTMEQPYVEIKEGTPGNETLQANRFSIE